MNEIKRHPTEFFLYLVGAVMATLAALDVQVDAAAVSVVTAAVARVITFLAGKSDEWGFIDPARAPTVATHHEDPPDVP